MSATLAMSVDQYSIFTLRCAAAEWLKEHPESLNAPVVRSALIATNYTVEGGKFDGD